MPIHFYLPRDPFGEFSNFAPYGIEGDGLWWPTVEHYFQAQKFADPEYREQIRSSPSAKQASDLGRSRNVPVRVDWEQVKDEVMLQGVRRKFQTHRAVRERLLATGDEPLIENAPYDTYWGCGKDGTGQNKLGKILEQVRAELRLQEQPLEGDSTWEQFTLLSA